MAVALRRSYAVALSVLVGIGAGVGGVRVVEPRLPTSPTLVGLRVAGREVPLGSDLRGYLQAHASAFAERRVVLAHIDKRFEVSMAELGGSVDVDATLQRALDYGHRGSIFKRWRETQAAQRGEIDVPLVYRLDEDKARAVVNRYADELHRDPVDAELDLVNHAKVPDRPGEELDLAATVESIAQSFAGEGELDLVTRSLPAEVKVADLDDIDVSKVLASFETRYQSFKVGRSKNVELATKKLNGAILRPLQTLSFNKRVGPRSTEAGFQPAPEILGDELSVGIGGGTCQVASTLHGAAIHGGLAVLDRKSHSRLSNYIALGLDATVAYPEVDLKLQNPFNFSVIVHAFIPEPGIVRVELLGGDEVEKVEYTYGVSSVEDYVRRITIKNFLKPGTSVRKQKGTRGMDVFSYVTIRFKSGRVEERRYYSGYRPTPEVFWVAADYDQGELPPLPKHAKGVEGRLHEDGSDVYEG